MNRKRKSSPSVETLYVVLDLAPGETHDTIQLRYRELTRKHHPDRGGDHDFFCKVTEAGSVLLDEGRRRAYDATLRLTRTPCPKCDGDGRTFIQVTFTQRVSRRCATCNGVGYVAKS